jgi:hypothetical protein
VPATKLMVTRSKGEISPAAATPSPGCGSSPNTLYKGRARIGHALGELKRLKRMALCCEKTAQNDSTFPSPAASSSSNPSTSRRCEQSRPAERALLSALDLVVYRPIMLKVQSNAPS